MGTVRSSKDKNVSGFTLSKVKQGLFAPAPATGAPVVVRTPGKAGSGQPPGQEGNSVFDATLGGGPGALAVACGSGGTGGTLITCTVNTFAVQGDFNVKFIKTPFLGSAKSVFSFWLHSQFVEAEGDRVVLHRCDMDKANKEKGADFCVDITFGTIGGQ
jgi:hypothetical protein